MARQRLVKPAFFKHRDLFDAEVAAGLPLRLAYEGLWCQADRRGVFRCKATELKLDILPYDPVDFEAVLAALEQHGFIVRYVVAGKAYGFIPTLADHQTFHKNEKPSADPMPPRTRHRAETVPAPSKHRASTPGTGTGTVAVAGTDAVAVPESRLRRTDHREDVNPNNSKPPGFVEPTPEEREDLERRKAEAKAMLRAAATREATPA